MTDSSMLVGRVDARIQRRLQSARAEHGGLSPELERVFTLAQRYLGGGKRLRAQFCIAGFRAAGGDPAEALAIDAAAALELFHAAALAHDDLIDRSDTRRGAPSAHREFESLHESSGWAGDAPHFGVAAAILLGDLLLMWSDDLMEDATRAAAASGRSNAASAATAEFASMRSEVTLGQYLDVVEEMAWPRVPLADRVARAITVAGAKSARYSVERPIVLGARLAGADDRRVEAIRAFGLPLGLAFQLRDDELGVFGDPEVTGKPAGDDLREGKRTVLVAETEQRAAAADRKRFTALLGRAEASDADIAWMRGLIRECGALDAVEARIAADLARALAALDAAGLDPESTVLLRALADRTAHRTV